MATAKQILLNKDQAQFVGEQGWFEDTKVVAILQDDFQVPGTITGGGMEFHYQFAMELKPEEIKTFKKE